MPIRPVFIVILTCSITRTEKKSLEFDLLAGFLYEFPVAMANSGIDRPYKNANLSLARQLICN
ncbi:MAG: hypothetical protein V1918_06040, partial [Planctomycetota bacterium]